MNSPKDYLTDRAKVEDWERNAVGKNKHSVYVLCYECHTWGVNFPLERKCGNCNSMDTMTFYDRETIGDLIQQSMEVGRSTKRCTVCKKMRLLTEYHRFRVGSPRLMAKCKYCKHDYDQKRYYTKREHMLEVNRKYNQSEAGKARNKRTGMRMLKKYPHKWKAREMLRYAVKTGKIKKEPCVVCKLEKSEGHHPDYSKPLQVIWLCAQHHNDVHKGRINL